MFRGPEFGCLRGLEVKPSIRALELTIEVWQTSAPWLGFRV